MGWFGRDYGNAESVEDKSQRFKTDFKFEELVNGMDVLNARINTKSTILFIREDKVIETLDRANKKSLKDSGGKKGIDCKNLYLFEDFCRTFKRVK